MRVLNLSVQFGLRRTLAVVGLMVLMASGLNAADVSPRLLRAGAYAIDITPTTFPVSSSGSMTHRMADQAHDPLHALGGYETWRAKSSYLAVDAATQIQATLLKLLEEVAR